jgi:hypothetical protein
MSALRLPQTRRIAGIVTAAELVAAGIFEQSDQPAVREMPAVRETAGRPGKCRPSGGMLAVRGILTDAEAFAGPLAPGVLAVVTVSVR